MSTKNDYSHIKQGKITVGGKTFRARSGWEANIAAYFQFLKEQGEIFDWQHEPRTFWFTEIKRGVRSYLPDFRVIENSGLQKYVEVKGYMDTKSATKIKRMAIYYPEIHLEVIDKKRYWAIAKNHLLYKEWGKLGYSNKGKVEVETKKCRVAGCTEPLKDKGFCEEHLFKIFKIR